VRAEIVRVYKAVHTWAGILSGMALFIAFYAGALTVFKEPLARWVAPPAAQTALPLSEAPALILQTLRAHPEAARDFSLQLRSIESEPYPLQWTVRPAGADDHEAEHARHYAATLEAPGQLRVDATHPSQLADFIDTLHRVVGLPVDNDPSRWFMGAVAVLYTVALVSGLIVLLPSLMKDLFALRVGKNLKRMWLDAHNVVGLFSLPFHLVMALTAVVFAFHDGIYALQDRVIHAGRMAAIQSQRGNTAAAAAPRDPAALLAPTALIARAQALAPGFEPTHLQYLQATGPRAVVRVWGHDAAALSPRAVGGFVAVDPYNGRIVNTDYLPGRQGAALTLIASFFALHMASFGGTAVQWMYFVLGLAGAWLFYSGNLLWIESRRRKIARDAVQAPPQSRAARWMASATVGVCLGSVCGLSLTIVTGKWLHGLVDDLNAWHHYAYYAMFFGALLWSLVRGAARAAVPLLWLAALLTLTLPLTSLIGALVPALGWWAHTSAASLGVDATALGGACAFALLARASARRLRQAEADSVWAPANTRQNPSTVQSAPA
jgi:uncharacterized iron-regulated membrane protein